MPVVTDIAAARDRRTEERKRCRTAKRQQRERDGSILGTHRGNRYNAEDYAEEWLYLTWSGMRSDDIIARSRPARAWFTAHVLPRVNKSLCATCGILFDPQVTGSLTRCTKSCGLPGVSADWRR